MGKDKGLCRPGGFPQAENSDIHEEKAVKQLTFRCRGQADFSAPLLILYQVGIVLAIFHGAIECGIKHIANV